MQLRILQQLRPLRLSLLHRVVEIGGEAEAEGQDLEEAVDRKYTHINQ